MTYLESDVNKEGGVDNTAMAAGVE